MEDNYTPPVKRLIEGHQRNNPPPIPQLTLPISVPNDRCARRVLSSSPYIQATGDVIIISFYYLLRCREYTTPRYFQRRNGTLMRATRTKYFTVVDVGLR